MLVRHLDASLPSLSTLYRARAETMQVRIILVASLKG